MKRWIVVGCLTAIVAAATVLSIDRTNPEVGLNASPVQTDPVSADTVLGVDELMRNADHYTGPLRVAGVVSAVSSAGRTLGLIDIQEFEECGVTTCASLTLPVKWSGLMPSIGDTVHVEGEIQEAEGKLFFVGHTLEKLEFQSGG